MLVERRGQPALQHGVDLNAALGLEDVDGRRGRLVHVGHHGPVVLHHHGPAGIRVRVHQPPEAAVAQPEE
eukprot:2403834-Alexandrium_andersonii.AAC.1